MRLLSLSIPTGISRLLTLMLLFVGLSTAHATQTVTYYHSNALGSPVAATDEAGNVLWREAYEPYGLRLIKDANSSGNSRYFTGHPEDSSTGLTYMGSRFYDPRVGRFMSPDPQRFSDTDLSSFNRYAYVGNNPYGHIDPDGEAKVKIGGNSLNCYGGGSCIGGGAGGGGYVGGGGAWTLPTKPIQGPLKNASGTLKEAAGKARSSAIGGSPRVTVKDLFSRSQPGVTKRRATQRHMAGGEKQMKRDFSDLGPDNIKSHSGGVRSGTLSDGRTVVGRPAVTRPDGTVKPATLEIQDGSKRIKFRY